MTSLPGCVFILDTRVQHNTIKEANRLGIPVIAIIDTNCDPNGIHYPIPGNDDAIRSLKLFTSQIADACLKGLQLRNKWEETERTDDRVIADMLAARSATSSPESMQTP